MSNVIDWAPGKFRARTGKEIIKTFRPLGASEIINVFFGDC